jgi:hypothetical protein
LTLAETEAELSSFYASTHQWNLARESSERALKNDPKLASARQGMGFVLMHEGKDDEAAREFSQALDLDNKLYRALFAKTMLSALPHSTNRADQETFRSELLNVLKLNPRFAPANIEIAKIEVAQDRPAIGLEWALKAEKLEPWRSGYHVFSGQILLRMERYSEAAAHAAYVAEHWQSTDHDEAIELWNLVPAEKRPTQGLEQIALAKDVNLAEGIVKSVDCGENKIAVTLEKPGQQSMMFNLHHVGGGFTDTLWFGADHFNPCYHTTGLRAVISYKAGTDKSYTGEALQYGFRDDLPPAPGSNTSVAQSSESIAR